MKTGQFNFGSIKEHCSISLASRVKAFAFIMLSVFILLPALSQADGLFDFQMTLAQKGNIEAQFKVGEMYETGFGVEKNMAEASNWINKAASKGHETAKLKLFYWDVEKNGLTATNRTEFESLKTKAEADDPQAQYYLGKMYGRGVGVKQDSNTAITWLNKAAFVGVLEAEREVVIVREDKQRQALARRRDEERKNAELRAQQENERLEKQEAQHQLQAQKQEAVKAHAEELAKQNKAMTEAQIKANKEASAQAKAKAEKQAEKIAEEQRLEAQKQALLNKRAADEDQRKSQFESDPCSGKSARFLSTCR